MVKDTNAETNTAPATTTPNSLNKKPTKPCKNITGINTTANVIEVDTTAKKISLLPSLAASFIGSPSSNFLNIFSVTTIPSSTTNPVANTIASRVNTLIENPAKYMIKKVAIKEIGISIKGRMAINQFLKKKKITNTTNANEMTMVSFTSESARLTLMVLSIGAGSLMCSHVNDTGFWMFKEYFGISISDTFKTWTVMETIIGIMGLVGVSVLNLFVG